MKFSVLMAGCALSFLATPALAQSAAPAAAAEEPTTGLQDIVVTAQRRSENLQRAAIAVSAITGDDLAAAGVIGSTSPR